MTHLRGRSVLALEDFSPAELLDLLRLGAELKAAKRGGFEVPKPQGQKHRADFRKGLHPHPQRLRSGGL